MLACYPRRQHANSSSLPSPTSSHFNFLSNLHNQDSVPSPTELQNDRLLRNYFQQQSSTSRPDANQFADQYMTGSYDFSNPSIRIQQSTPGPQLPATYNLMMDNGANALGWDFANNGQLTTGPSTLHSSAINNSRRTHQRSPSSSTNASTISATSAYNPAFHYYPNSEQHPSTPQAPKVESSYNAEDISGTFSNHLPTPSHTPTQDTFNNNNNYSTFNNMNVHDGGMAAHMAMKQALMDQHHQVGNDGSCPDFGHSSRQSVSSYGADSPATPHNAQEDNFSDDRFKVPSNGEKSYPRVENWIDEYLQFPDDPDMRPVPKLDRTMTDIYADELFNPNAMVAAPAKQSSQSSNNTALLSPFRNVMNDRLQAAHQARSQSPASTLSRGVSPFRQGSPLAPPSNSFASPQVRLGSAQQLREQQKAESDAYALQRSQRQPDMSEPKTISPKDALLDYHESEEDSKMPLFPDASGSDYDHSYTSGDQAHYDGSSEVSYGSTATSQAGSWSGQATANFPSVSGPSPPQSNFNFVAPSVPSVMAGLSFTNTATPYRSVTSIPASGQDENPQFHPQLTSMDSSASEMPESSQASNDDSSTPVQRPDNSHADTGTYTCTYHGCSLRFETPQKLQKHKRDGHRPHVATPGVGSGMTSAQLLARNSQAGPHKCERVNPTTGKPCNTIFSRPYDLTRHEDTIHNARKQKVRCALCVEEKTFSRNDALTRHMRVVHPEVDFPGKHRRRGGGSSYE
ncbi:Zinc finger C2H2-type protein [Lasiodiplodia theobromae]|nr:Zinc finger C2H2-type protein [Lasiodiplodia theobromae]